MKVKLVTDDACIRSFDFVADRPLPRAFRIKTVVGHALFYFEVVIGDEAFFKAGLGEIIDAPEDGGTP